MLVVPTTICLASYWGLLSDDMAMGRQKSHHPAQSLLAAMTGRLDTGSHDCRIRVASGLLGI